MKRMYFGENRYSDNQQHLVFSRKHSKKILISRVQNVGRKLKKQTKKQASGIRRRRISSPVPNLGPVPNSALEKLSSRALCDADFFAVPNSAPPVPNLGPVPNSALHITCDAEFWRRMLNSASHVKIRRRDHKSRAEFRRRGPSGYTL